MPTTDYERGYEDGRNSRPKRPRSGRRWPEVVMAEVQAAYERGITSAEIARVLNCPRQQVDRWVRAWRRQPFTLSKEAQEALTRQGRLSFSPTQENHHAT